MKHLNYFPGRRARPKEDRNEWRTIRFIWATMLLAGFWTGLWGQCNMICVGSPNIPLQVAVNQACDATLVPDALIDTALSCPGTKSMVVRDTGNVIIAQGIDIVTFDASAYIGDTLAVTVTDLATSVACQAFIFITDNIAPTLDCQVVHINCFVDRNPDVIGYPVVTDNCDPDVSMIYTDSLAEDTCNSLIAAVVFRSWLATDHSGNQQTCVQQILLDRPQLDSIVFPRDTTISCNYPTASPDSLGRPELDSIPIHNGVICDWVVIRSDDTIIVCGTIGYNILRTWQVTDVCANQLRAHVQTIRIRDTKPPQLTCPTTITVNAITGQCYGNVTLPIPEAVDNCDPSPGLAISTSYGAQSMGPHPFVPVGQHTITYSATDDCNNSSTCTVTLHVVDNQPPIAVCDDQVVVALPETGVAYISANSFDEGSEDNCPKPLYFKVKRVDTTGACVNANGDDAPNVPGYQEWLDDKIFFCCDDATGPVVPVIMHTYEINPGPGPVNPAREAIGGDLYGHYSECTSTVRVQDNLKPVFYHLPQNPMTVSCTSDLTNQAAFGSPLVSDNCSYTVDSIIVTNLNDCSAGTITRTFTATDPSGNTKTWTQTINVVNDAVLTQNQIVWPQNYTTYTCGASVTPADLPDGYNIPVLPEGECGVINYSFQDQVFNVAQPACYKILRTWTVLDWCHYDPSNPSGGGRFTYVQTIKVQDNIPPVLNCPGEITVGVGNTCSGAQVTLPTVTATDCHPNVQITNNSPYATSNGANASGFYPKGTTVVTFTASDHCGNTSTCQVTVKVVDNTPPAPVCIVGLSVNLSIINGEEQAIVTAAAFDGGSSDNCTPSANLVRTIRRSGGNQTTPPTTTQLTFTCEDIGNQLVELWVTDAVGNSNFCLTYVLIQDNNHICPFNTTSGMIAGGIQTEDDHEVQDVSIDVMGSNGLHAMTNNDGAFQFAGLPFGSNYSVVPQRDDDPLNGVSTLDLVLISRHILGTQPLNSPYKIIAADVDRSGTVATSDLIKLRKLILHIENQMPNGNKSWRFIPADFQFPDPTNPFASYFPEMMHLNNFGNDEMHADFIAIKVGDVNCSALPNNLQNLEDREDNGSFTLIADNKRVTAGETFDMDFYGHGMDYIPGYQFTLQFDTDKLELVETGGGELPGVSEANFGLGNIGEGLISSSWNESVPYDRSEKVRLFKLTFRALTDLEVQNVLQLSPRVTPPEAYTRTLDVLGVNLMFSNAAAPNTTNKGTGYELYQNRPNPFADETIVAFLMPQSGTARLTVFDATGKLIYQYEASFESGYNEVTISKNELPISGVLYYQLEAGAWKDTKKMILLD